MPVRKLLVLALLVGLAVVFVQPIHAYRAAQAELASAHAQLAAAKEAKVRAAAERKALGTRAVLVREARRRGYIFPGETPYAVNGR